MISYVSAFIYLQAYVNFIHDIMVGAVRTFFLDEGMVERNCCTAVPYRG